MSVRIITKPAQSATILDAYNQWRAEKQLPPIQQHTLVRYLSGGSGYENGPPKRLVEFLRTIV